MGKGKPYLYEVGEVVNETLRIVKQIRVKSGKQTARGYVVKSLAYPADKNDYEMSENSLKAGSGCAYLAGKRVCEESSLWSVESIRGNIINIEEAKKISRSNGKRILFKCNTDKCDTTKKMAVRDLTRQGFSCPSCSKGTKYPERYTQAYLIAKKIPHETQVKYDDLGLRRYDFRIKLNGVTFLLEVHGNQHFLTEDKGYHKVETIQESDNIKRQYAKDNGINYIELDCRESSFEFIRNSIAENNILPNIEDSEVDVMLEIMDLNSKYPIKDIKDAYLIGRKTTYQIAKIYNTTDVTIQNILRRQNVELRDHNASKGRPVRCIETGKIYNSGHQAARELGLKSLNKVSDACNGKVNSAGKHPITNKPLHWEFLSGAELKAYYHAEYRRNNPTLEIELNSTINN